MAEDKTTVPSPGTAPTAKTADAAAVMTIFVTTVATLYFGREVLLPVTMALLLAFLLAPLVDLLGRAHLGRIPAVLLAVVLSLGVIISIGGLIGSQVAQLTSNLSSYAAAVEAKTDTIHDYTVGRLAHLADLLGRHGHGAAAMQQPDAGALPPAAPLAMRQQPPESPLTLAQRYLTPVLSPLATIGIVFIVAVFALVQREDLRDRLIWLAGSGDLKRTTLAINEGGRRLSRYFLAQLSINTGFGVVVGIGLLSIGVPNPVLWAILSALLRFVPYVGSLISALLPMTLSAAVEPGWAMVFWTAGLYLVLELFTGQVIEPIVYGHSTGLSPFSVIVAAIFWSWVWGPVGLILSTPLTLSLVVLGRHSHRLKFLDVMLGDRPALNPAECFYQAMLEGDLDELEERAQSRLKAGPLVNYYDEVALEGLRLAASDVDRAGLTHEQLEKVRTNFGTLLDFLGAHDASVGGAPPGREVLPTRPAPPEAWRAGAAVLCIAGRGALDGGASSMLLQLLERQGFGGRLVAYDDVSRDRVMRLDVAGVKLACICQLEADDNPASLRFLVQRLRQRLVPGTPIFLGFRPAATDPEGQPPVEDNGADYGASSLADLVRTCCALTKAPSGLAAGATPHEATSSPAPPSLTQASISSRRTPAGKLTAGDAAL